MPQHRKHYGTVYQRKDGRWVGAVVLDGKRTIFYGQSRQEANNMLQAFLTGRRVPSYTELLAENLELRLRLSRYEPVSFSTMSDRGCLRSDSAAPGG